jgi:putative oxidoreductase
MNRAATPIAAPSSPDLVSGTPARRQEKFMAHEEVAAPGDVLHDPGMDPAWLPAPVAALRRRALHLVARGTPAALLLGRLAMGLLFVNTGWGKVHDIPKVVGFFVELKIPLPALNAVVVSWSELLCGTALIVGLGTRLATIPLIISMIVAILTARLGDIHGLGSLAQVDEFTYFALLVVLAFVGPGALSLDALLFRSRRRVTSATRPGVDAALP